MNQTYHEIMNLKEAEEFKAVIQRWHVLSENLSMQPVDAPVLLPDMLWVAKSGVGKTNLLELMSEYLASKGNLMEFYGDVKFFEFYLNYRAPEEDFSELSRLIEEIKSAAGFRSEYKGVIYININEWIDHFEEKHFVTVMEYLATYSDNWLVVLGVDPDQDEKIRKLNSFLSMYLRIEKIELSFPKTEDLFGFIENTLNQYGLTLDEGARKMLYDSIEKMRNSKYFDGFRTLKLLCQDIVYDVFSQENADVFSLSATDLVKFGPDSEYIRNKIDNFERAVRVGGGQQGDE